MKKLLHPFLALLIVLFIGSIEGDLYPVVRLWHTQSIARVIEPTGTSIHVLGHMHKVRDCKFIGVKAESDTHEQLPIVFLDSSGDDTRSRPTGSQPWGPWRVQITPATQSVEFYAMHECHPLWVTKSYLGEVLVTR